MKKIYELSDELFTFKNKIEKNLEELSHSLNEVYRYGGIVDIDWSVVKTSMDIPSELIQKVNVIGHKSEELKTERDEKNKEFLIACGEEYEKQIDKVKEVLPEWYVERLIAIYSKEAGYGIISALENLKKMVDSTQPQSNI